jgi:hypothetical protein
VPNRVQRYERLIGVSRRECLHHLIMLDKQHLWRERGEYVENFCRGQPRMTLE